MTEQSQRLAAARAALAQVEARQDMRAATSTSLQEERVGVYHLYGSVQGLAQGLAQIVKAGQYVAVVGVDDVSWEGVAAFGVDVSRVVVIRAGNSGQELRGQELRGQGMKVIASLVEGFSVVVVGNVEVAPRHQRALAGRARKLGATILTMKAWNGVSSALVSPRSAAGVSVNRLASYRSRGA